MIRAQRAWQKTGAFSGLFLLLLSWGQTWAGSSLASLELETLQLGASQLEWSRALGLTRHPLAGMSGSWLQGKYRGGVARVWIGTSSLSTKPSLASVRQEWADALNAQRSATPGILISDQGCAILSDGSY